MAGLSDKQKVFVTHYLQTLNASEAARQAKYRNPGQAGFNQLKNVNVQAALKQSLSRKIDNLDEDVKRILEHLRRIAFSDISDYVNFRPDGWNLKSSDGWVKGSSQAIQEVHETVTITGGSAKFKLYDKLKAIELLGKYYKIFAERVEHTGKDGAHLSLNDPLTDMEKMELTKLRAKLKKK